MSYQFRKAEPKDAANIWSILEQAIERRRQDGSNQWQDGYPNPKVVQSDIDREIGYVLTLDDQVIGYCAVLINDEPAYADIEGKWFTNSDFVVIHRVAIAEQQIGQGLSKKLLMYVEDFATTHGIFSIKADTNFDNMPMMRIFEKLGYKYCGEVYFRGSARRAYEKVLSTQP